MKLTWNYNLYYPLPYVINRFTLTEGDNAWRFRNYFRTKAIEIYDEQTPGTQYRIGKFRARIQNLNKRYNPVKREKAPGGKEFLRRHLIGGATSLADVLDGKHAVKRSLPKTSPQRKKRSRKRKVVK